MLPNTVVAELSAPCAHIPQLSDAQTLMDAAFVQTSDLLTSLHQVKLPEGMP